MRTSVIRMGYLGAWGCAPSQAWTCLDSGRHMKPDVLLGDWIRQLRCTCFEHLTTSNWQQEVKTFMRSSGACNYPRNSWWTSAPETDSRNRRTDAPAGWPAKRINTSKTIHSESLWRPGGIRTPGFLTVSTLKCQVSFLLLPCEGQTTGQPEQRVGSGTFHVGRPQEHWAGVWWCLVLPCLTLKLQPATCL